MNDLWFYLPIVMLTITMAAFQIYFAVEIFRIDRSIGWTCIALLLFAGINVLVYQTFKLEKAAGYSFEKLSLSERKRWRRIYTMLIGHFIILFIVVGVILTPSIFY
ncbi:hypothetical protein [Paenibacillus sp. L3-i20]|uniref:hypothetical protein n=1 Tax=Paenibacillus sp. L3-i20 TaxID=2905833 RepID=UPI001EDF8EA4|nr:hypothetical protein [Paenibacillus sp. L3-i20]GKU78107.1 hypothetical protein L3i20_v225040 [Paenibacillus sp. L3-i20]